jgi:hypothetical protein
MIKDMLQNALVIFPVSWHVPAIVSFFFRLAQLEGRNEEGASIMMRQTRGLQSGRRLL